MTEADERRISAMQAGVIEAQDVAVQSLTFVEAISSFETVARIYAGLRAMGLLLLRCHSHRAQKFASSTLRK